MRRKLRKEAVGCTDPPRREELEWEAWVGRCEDRFAEPVKRRPRLSEEARAPHSSADVAAGAATYGFASSWLRCTRSLGRDSSELRR